MCQCWLLSFDKSITDKTNMRRFWRSISTGTPNNLCNFTANLELFTNKKFIKHLLPHKTKTTRKRSGRLLSYLSRSHKYPSQTLYIYTFLVNMTNIHNITECKISDKKTISKGRGGNCEGNEKGKVEGIGGKETEWGMRVKALKEVLSLLRHKEANRGEHRAVLCRPCRVPRPLLTDRFRTLCSKLTECKRGLGAARLLQWEKTKWLTWCSSNPIFSSKASQKIIFRPHLAFSLLPYDSVVVSDWQTGRNNMHYFPAYDLKHLMFLPHSPLLLFGCIERR